MNILANRKLETNLRLFLLFLLFCSLKSQIKLFTQDFLNNFSKNALSVGFFKVILKCKYCILSLSCLLNGENSKNMNPHYYFLMPKIIKSIGLNKEH